MGFAAGFQAGAAAVKAGLEIKEKREERERKKVKDIMDAEAEAKKQKAKDLKDKRDYDLKLNQAKVDLDQNYAKNIADENISTAEAVQIYTQGAQNLGLKSGRYLVNDKDGVERVLTLPIETGYETSKEIQSNVTTYGKNALYDWDKSGVFRTRQNEMSEWSYDNNITSVTAGQETLSKGIVGGIEFGKTDMGRGYVQHLKKEGLTEKDLSFADYKKKYWNKDTADKVTGYTTGLKDQMSETEVQYFKDKGIDPNNVSMLVLQAKRKADISGEKRTDFDKKVGFITQAGELTTNLYNGTTSIFDMTTTDIGKMATAEKLAGYTPGDKLGQIAKDIVGSEKSLNAGYNLTKYINALKPEEVDFGMFDKAVQGGKKLISDDQWNGMSKESKQKALLSIAVGTKIGNALAQYIKSISGTAVAEAEYNRLQKIFTTGNFSNLQSVKEAINTFYEDLEDNYESTLRDNMLQGGSFTASKLKTLSEKAPLVVDGKKYTRATLRKKIQDEHPELDEKAILRILRKARLAK